MEVAVSPAAGRGVTIKNIAGLVLLVLLAVVFGFSAISKIDSLDAFEWSFLDLGIRNFTVAAVVARLMIGLELLIAFFLVAHLYLKKITYPLTLGLLLAFTIYLGMLLVKQGNTGNCGCFGDWIYMSPLSSIYKNLGMMAAVVVLWFIYPGKEKKESIYSDTAAPRFSLPIHNKFQHIMSPLIGMVAIVIPFIVYPMSLGHEPVKAHEPIDLNALYRDSTGKNNIAKEELRDGKHIVAYMSLTCPHCRKAAYLLQILHRQHPELPISFVLAGNPKYEKEFFDETHAQAVPHVMMYDRTDDFIKMAGPSVPAIYWINNSVIEAKSNYNQLDPGIMKDWLKR